MFIVKININKQMLLRFFSIDLMQIKSKNTATNTLQID